MKEIILTNISGVTPFDVYAADFAGNNKEYVGNISGDSNIVISSNIFNTMSEIMIIFSGSDGCEKFKIVPCGLL